MDLYYDIWILYMAFLLYIAPFHLLAWSIRFFRRKGKSKGYNDSLMYYIRAVVVYMIGFVLFAFFQYRMGIDSSTIGLIYLYSAGLFPLYYWKNIFWVTFKKRLGI